MIKKCLCPLVLIISLLIGSSTVYAENSSPCDFRLHSNLVMKANRFEKFEYAGIRFKKVPVRIKENICRHIDEVVDKSITPYTCLTGIKSEYVISNINDPMYFKYKVDIDMEKFNDYISRKIESKFSNLNICTRNYYWFVSQQFTGEYSNNNCGFACINMVLKLCRKDKGENVESLRKSLGIGSGLNLKAMSGLLSNFKVDNSVENYGDLRFEKVDFNSTAYIIAIDNGLYTNIEKTNSYHSLLVNGYFSYNSKEYLVVYDPTEYPDSALLAKDRWIDNSISEYTTALVIEKDRIMKYIEPSFILKISDIDK